MNEKEIEAFVEKFIVFVDFLRKFILNEGQIENE